MHSSCSRIIALASIIGPSCCANALASESHNDREAVSTSTTSIDGSAARIRSGVAPAPNSGARTSVVAYRLNAPASEEAVCTASSATVRGLEASAASRSEVATSSGSRRATVRYPVPAVSA